MTTLVQNGKQDIGLVKCGEVNIMIKITIGKTEASLECPDATQDLELNTKNRNAAIQAEHIQYGPLNLADTEYWARAAEHWNTEPEVA